MDERSYPRLVILFVYFVANSCSKSVLRIKINSALLSELISVFSDSFIAGSVIL